MPLGAAREELAAQQQSGGEADDDGDAADGEKARGTGHGSFEHGEVTCAARRGDGARLVRARQHGRERQRQHERRRHRHHHRDSLLAEDGSGQSAQVQQRREDDHQRHRARHHRHHDLPRAGRHRPGGLDRLEHDDGVVYEQTRGQGEAGEIGVERGHVVEDANLDDVAGHFRRSRRTERYEYGNNAGKYGFHDVPSAMVFWFHRHPHTPR